MNDKLLRRQDVETLPDVNNNSPWELTTVKMSGLRIQCPSNLNLLKFISSMWGERIMILTDLSGRLVMQLTSRSVRFCHLAWWEIRSWIGIWRSGRVWTSRTVTRVTRSATTTPKVISDFFGTGFTNHIGRHKTLTSIAFTEVETIFVALSVNLMYGKKVLKGNLISI